MALTWTQKGNLKGPQGETGAQGAPGEPGASYRACTVNLTANTSASTSTIVPSAGIQVGDLLTDPTGAVFPVASLGEGTVQTGEATGQNLRGPQGAQGPAGADGQDGKGVTILGSYDSEGALEEAHPTGNDGDAYLVQGNLYVWDSNSSSWKNVGTIQGPAGAKGDPGHYTLANGKPCNFVVLQKDCLKELGRMNQQGTSGGGWDRCERRTWCNSVYRNAIPSSLRGIFKQFKVRTATGTGSSSKESTDWFSLFSEKEVFGSTTLADSSAERQCSQLDYYKTSSNRIKRVNGSAGYWWERSPHARSGGRFCNVTDSGAANWYHADGSRGLAPFGCI